MADISELITVAELLKRHPAARRVFDRHGLHGCGVALRSPTAPFEPPRREEQKQETTQELTS